MAKIANRNHNALTKAAAVAITILLLVRQNLLIQLRHYASNGKDNLFPVLAIQGNKTQNTTPLGSNSSLPPVLFSPSSISSQTKAKTTRVTKVVSIPESNKTKAAQCVENSIAAARAKSNTEQLGRRQILYIHPGPGKTATTTIQKLLTIHKEKLKQDNIFLVGKEIPERWECGFPVPLKCTIYHQHNQKSKKNCVQIMKDQLDEYYKAGVDVILTDEMIGLQMKPKDKKKHQSGIEEFFETVVQRNDWEVRFLLGYRPYFEFVRSQFGQQHKVWGTKPLYYHWPGEKKSKKKKKKHKSKRGKRVPPLNEHLLEVDWPFTDVLLDGLQPYADSFDVFDITGNTTDGQGDFTVHFFCNLLVNATNACASQKSRVASPGKDLQSNVAKEWEFDRIATAAADHGLIDTSRLKRHNVGIKIKERMKRKRANIDDLPMVCPTHETAMALYNQSLAKEMRLFPRRNPHWMVEESFAAIMAKKKLCSVDVDKVLEDKEWKTFFESLKK